MPELAHETNANLDSSAKQVEASEHDAVQPDSQDRDRARRQHAKVVVDLLHRLNSLTPREREILALIVSGARNKQIAGRLGLSEMTVKVHRSQIMRKMRAKSLVDLVRMTDKLGVSTTSQSE